MLPSEWMRYPGLLLLLLPRLAFCWGAEGHHIILRLAEGLLTPEARARVQATLSPGEALADLGSWADQVRNERKETAPWHYINIELNEPGLDMRRDCPQNDCIAAKIVEFRKGWRDPAAAPAARREALLFLVHFVGDLHQPLHCTDNHDEGGNLVQVRFRGREMKLHALWDRGLLEVMPAEDELLAKLSQALTPEHVAQWSQGTVEQWTDESFQIGRTVVYGELPPAGAGGLPEIGAAYERAAEGVVESQLEKAAARLAAILNQSAR